MRLFRKRKYFSVTRSGFWGASQEIVVMFVMLRLMTDEIARVARKCCFLCIYTAN